MSKTIPYSINTLEYKKIKLPRSKVEHITRYCITILSKYRELFSKYYLLYWSPEYLYDRISDGQILHDGIIYNVIYADKKNPPYYLRHHSQVALSFRAPLPEFGIVPVVLIYGVNK